MVAPIRIDMQYKRQWQHGRKEQAAPVPLEENAEAWDVTAECTAEATVQKPATPSFKGAARALKLLELLFLLLFLPIGPNVGYILVVLSTLNQQKKIAREMALTLSKTAIGTLLVPRIARKAVDLLVLNGALTFARFRLCAVLAATLSSTTMILLPAAILLVTDKRCLHYVFKPPAVVTNVPISYCYASDYSTGLCEEYATLQAGSTYTPSFNYDGEVCVSAVLSGYVPVYLGVVLLAATLPIGMETIFVPWLAPCCYQNAESSTVARTCLRFYEQ